MKFIRNWIKKIVAESMMDNFPPINISVTERKTGDCKLHLENGVYVNSRIVLSKELDNKDIEINHCSIHMNDPHATFIVADWNK